MSIYEGLSEPSHENFKYLASSPHTLNPELEWTYLNMNNSGIAGLKNSFLNSIAMWNPFHMQQTPDLYGRAYHRVKNGAMYYKNKAPSHKMVLDHGVPAHFNPAEDTDYEHEFNIRKYNVAANKVIKFRKPEFPYICEVNKKKIKLCKSINGADAKCESEINDFLEQCPNFALHLYRQNKMFNESAKQIQREEYKEAMQVSDYNKGRSVADINSSVQYSDGMAHNLRPDSMWADDRYIDITQKEIDVAKANVEKKRTGKYDRNDLKPLHHTPKNEAQYTRKQRMY